MFVSMLHIKILTICRYHHYSVALCRRHSISKYHKSLITQCESVGRNDIRKIAKTPNIVLLIRKPISDSLEIVQFTFFENKGKNIMESQRTYHSSIIPWFTEWLKVCTSYVFLFWNQGCETFCKFFLTLSLFKQIFLTYSS